MGPFVFALLVAAGEGDAPDTAALLQALGEALGSEVKVVAREGEGPRNDQAMLALERATGSAVTAAVAWSGGEKLEARVRLHLRSSDRWIDRGLSFAPSDDLRERGRALGFTLASMLPDRTPSPAAARPPPPMVVAAPPPPPSRLAVDLMVLGSLGVGGNADGLGGAFAMRWAVSPKLALRAELMGRTGVVQAAEATALSLHLGLGVAFSPLGDPAARRANLEIRGDLAMLYESLGHLSPD